MVKGHQGREHKDQLTQLSAGRKRLYEQFGDGADGAGKGVVRILEESLPISSACEDTQLFIAGQWVVVADEQSLLVVDPATDGVIGQVARTSRADLQRVAEAALYGLKSTK